MPMNDKRAGKKLASLRKQRGLTLRAVRDISEQIAALMRNRAFIVQASSLSQIEMRGGVPSIYKLYSLSIAYGCAMRRILSFYGLK